MKDLGNMWDNKYDLYSLSLNRLARLKTGVGWSKKNLASDNAEGFESSLIRRVNRLYIEYANKRATLYK